MQRIRNATQHLENLAKTAAVPSDHRPIRLPTFPALERTAVMAFTDTSTVSLAGNDHFAAILTRDPGYPLWIQKEFLGVASQFITENITPLIVLAGDNFSFPIANDTVGGHVGLPPLLVPMLSQEGKHFFNMGTMTPAITGSTFNFFVEITTTAGSIINALMQIEHIDGLGNLVSTEQRIVPSALVAGSQFVKASVPTDAIGARLVSLSLGVAGVATTVTSIRYGIATSPGIDPLPLTNPAASLTPIHRLFPISEPPEATTGSLIWSSVRCTAAAALFTNVTSVMNKEGTVNAARVPTVAFPAFNPFMWANFQTVHPKDRYFGALEHGSYAYTLPDISSEEFRDVVHYNTTNVACGVIDMDRINYATCFIFTDMDSAHGTNLAITLSRHTEFRTTSRLFQTDFSRESLETYHSAQMALVQMGTIFENTIHLKDIAAMAMKAARSVWPIVRPYAVQTATGLANQAAGWVNNKIRGNMQQAQMVMVKPTRAPRVTKRTPAKKRATARRRK